MSTPSLQCLEGLVYTAKDDHHANQSQKGIPYYDGSPYDFADWSIRIKARIAAAKADDAKKDSKLIELGADILCCLKGDAFRVARDLGPETATVDGPDKILEVLERDLLIRKKQHAIDLSRLFSKAGGPLARQPGEPIRSYVSRRRRAHERIKELDNGFAVSPEMQATYMLEAARLTDDQRLFITSKVETPSIIGHTNEMERLYHALHESERKAVERTPTSTYRPHERGYQAVRRPGKGKGKYGSSSTSAPSGSRYAAPRERPRPQSRAYNAEIYGNDVDRWISGNRAT